MLHAAINHSDDVQVKHQPEGHGYQNMYVYYGSTDIPQQ